VGVATDPIFCQKEVLYFSLSCRDAWVIYGGRGISPYFLQSVIRSVLYNSNTIPSSTNSFDMPYISLSKKIVHHGLKCFLSDPRIIHWLLSIDQSS
jgi:hypothetical protein